jgi:hypothetical protein
MLGLVGVKPMEVRGTAEVTVSTAKFEVMSDKDAMIKVVPALIDVASPELLIVATTVSDEIHVTDAFKSLLDWSE